MKSRAEWTFLLYCGTNHNGVHFSKEKLLALLEKAQVSSRVNFVYEIAGAKSTERGQVCWRSEDNSLKAVELESGPPVDYATSRSVAGFIDWATERFPSRRTALILRGHGAASLPPPSAPPVISLQEAAVGREPRARESSGLGQILLDGQKRRYASDRDLRSLVKATKRGRVNIYGFDACEMSTIEVAYEIRSVASYMIATEEVLGVAAFPYARALTLCSTESQVSSRRLARELAPREEAGSTPVDLVSINLSEVREVARRIDRVANVLCELVGKEFEKIDEVQRNLTPFPYHLEYDLLQVLDHFMTGITSSAELSSAIEEAKRALARAWHGAPPRLDSSCGVGIFFPALDGVPDLIAYGGLAFARETQWGEFIARYVTKKGLQPVGTHRSKTHASASPSSSRK